MKKEIPILYSTMMAKAKVEMRKTQTRRIAKNHPGNQYPSDECWYETYCSFKKYYSEDYAGDDKEKALGPTWLILNEDGDIDGFLGNCPYGQPGDLLWGRESFLDGFDYPCSGCHLEPADEDYEPRFSFKADCPEEQLGSYKFKPSIHMPKEAARIWDEVISVRVERVADISDADCIAEGILFYDDKILGRRYKDYEIAADGYGHPDHDYPSFDNAYASYRSLWQSINGEPKLTKDGYIVYPFNAECSKHFEGLTTWKGKPLKVVVNPWVWVIESKQLSVTGKPSSETDAVHRY